MCVWVGYDEAVLCRGLQQQTKLWNRPAKSCRLCLNLNLPNQSSGLRQGLYDLPQDPGVARGTKISVENKFPSENAPPLLFSFLAFL